MKTNPAVAEPNGAPTWSRLDRPANGRTPHDYRPPKADWKPALWRGLCLLLGTLLLPVLPARAVTNDLTSAIQRGLFEEEANRNLGAAIQAYQAVAGQFDKDRKLAATAIFRLGECYRKQGNTNEAAVQYERILREFSDQPTLVTLSRENLAVLGSAPPAAPALSDAARQEQKRLLQEEIGLVEKQLETERKKVQVGAAPSDSVFAIERDLLKLKRQMAALDAGLPISIPATETATPAASSEADELRHIQALVKDSPDLINAPQATGETLLETAAGKGKLAVVKLLLDSGAAVDGLQQPGLTALHYAAGNGHKAIVDLLLRKGAKPGAQTGAGVTPLHLAARKGYEEVAKALLAAGAPVNAETTAQESRDRPGGTLTYPLIGAGQTPLHLAATAGYAGLVELLLAKGADPNAVDVAGRTALSYAVQKHSQPVVELLLAAHANPNAGSLDLPLTEAAYYGDLPALKLLLANGANPTINTNLDGTFEKIPGRSAFGGYATPLAAAVSQKRAEAVAELIRAGADPNGTFSYGERLVFGALSDAPTLKALLEGGADPNLCGREKESPLLQAVGFRGEQQVELLLAHKAAVNVGKPWTGWTPLHGAADRGWKEIAELLLKAGADVNAKDDRGFTPLSVAVQRDQREMVELLLANKADPNERDKSGRTPLDYAKRLAPPMQGGQMSGYGLATPVPPAQTAAFEARYGLSRGPEGESKAETMTDLLRRYGALDNLPQLDRITVRRTATGTYGVTLTKGAHDWNQFTLLELLAMQYGFLAGSPDQQANRVWRSPEQFAQAFKGLHFPDLAHLHISRPAADLKSWQDRLVDLTPLLASGDCSKDVRLGWGELVEIPEAYHPLNENWGGFSREQLVNLKKCLTRSVQIVVKDKAKSVTLSPRMMNLEVGRIPMISPHEQYWLKPVLLQSKLVLISSDLSRVKVTRRDPATGQQREWVVDCSEAKPAPGFWLEDGDRIEVPEKTLGSATGQAKARQPVVIDPATGLPVRQVKKLQDRVGQHLDVGGVRYSPKADDSDLLEAGYHKDRSARPRQAECWEQRATSDLSGRTCPAVWTGTDMVVFGGEGLGTSFDDGARYCLAEDTWAMLPAEGAPSSRTGHAMVWTGKEVIVWGGFGGVAGRDTNRNDGARYSPATDTWKPMTTKNAPAARFDFPAVWTGKEMLVWGGYTDSHSRYQGGHADAHLNTGGRYNPSSDSWKTMTTEGAPSKRWAHTMVWTGKEMIVWGGANASKVLGDGARYDPARDSWKPVSTEGAPGPRASHVAVWTGKEMIVWGGAAREPLTRSDYFEDGARYNPTTDTWKPISSIGAPKGRVSATALWTGTELVVWGGGNDAQGNGGRFVGTGARYNPATDTWTEIATQGAPSPRLTTGVWTGDGLLTFGGYNGMHLNDTWLFSPQRTLYPYAKR